MKKLISILWIMFLLISCSVERDSDKPVTHTEFVSAGSENDNDLNSQSATGERHSASQLYFQENIWPVLKNSCVQCHNETFRGFRATPHGFAFIRSDHRDSLIQNKRIFADFAMQTSENLSLPVSKAMGGSGHGGGIRFSQDSQSFAGFELHVLEFLELLEIEILATPSVGLDESKSVNQDPGVSKNQLIVTFQNEIWPVLKSNCIGCHSPDGMANNTKFIFNRSDQISVLFDGFLPFALVNTTVQLPLPIAKSANLVPHGGQNILDPDGAIYGSFLESVRKLLSQYGGLNQRDQDSTFPPIEDSEKDEKPPVEIDASQETYDFFVEKIMPFFSKGDCFQCHLADKTMSGFKLSRDLQDTQLNLNYFTKYSVQTYKGIPVPVAKSLGWKSHGGGGIFLTNSEDYYQFLEVSQHFNQLIFKSKTFNVNQFFGNSRLKDPYLIARKAMIELGARLPSPDERKALSLGGFQALDTLLDHLLSGEEFYTWMDSVWEDHYFTNYWWYVNFFDRGRQPNFSGSVHQDLTGDAAAALRGTSRAGALATPMQDTPLDFVRFILEDGYDPDQPDKKIRPFTDIVSGRYMVANAFTAKVYGREVVATGEKDKNVEKYTITQNRFTTDHYQVQFVPDPDLFPGEKRIRNPFTEFFPIYKVVSSSIYHQGSYRSGGVQMSVSGLLTDPTFLAIYTSSQTNANRSRAAFIFKLFLDTDILTLGVPPSGSKISYSNPTMDNPDCISCHKVMDPVAGLFKNWDGTYGRFLDPNGPYSRHNQKPWRNDMRAPGYSESELYDPNNSLGPEGKPLSPVQWLGEKIANDDRFLVAMVKLMFRSLVGRVFEESDPDISGEEMIIFNQFIESLGFEFRKNNYNLRFVIKEIVKSPYYSADETTSNPFTTLGQGRLLSPENLFNKFKALLAGVPGRPVTPGELLGTYRILYGGIDGNQTRKRNHKINAVMANIQLRLAAKYSIEMGKDFSRPPEQRLFFPYGNQITTKGQDGFISNPDRPPQDPDSPEGRLVSDRITSNIVHLFEVLHGKIYKRDHPRIQRTYLLFQNIFDELAKDSDKSIPWDGRWTSPRMRSDDSGIMRAWIGVAAALIADYQFFHH